MIEGATQYNSSTYASSLGHCFRECFDDSLCYTFVYSLNICYKYGCDGNCKLTSGGVNTVYQRVCLRDCMPLMNTSQYAVTVTGGVTHGAIAKYTCKPDNSYQSGDLTRECQSNSTWSGIAPNCVADCGLPTPILNGSYTLSQGTTLGSTATLQCQAGFQLANGDSTLICDASSQWIGTQPVCEIIDCGQLGDLQNGLYNLSSGTQYGSIATASCLAGYTNQNTANIVCSDNGKWNGSLTDCTPVDCGPVQNIENGIVVATGSTFGQTANFYCIPGFKLIGPTLLKCNESSKWEPNLPSCRVKDTSSESLPKNLYIMPCICYNKTWTGLTQEQIIAHLIRNTSIDARNTTMALSKLSCRRDERPVSVIFGYVASGLIGGLFLLVVISDLPRLIHDFRFYF
ncbi:sushi, von Willebrand factor type A, EGF and pentraxin domain-containing protein 1-like [Dreissena polymorpha]|nr:sushi, von Willebrand factor type A, EGF and pentraxin domain-containing protein 1-like [Dreissena polymorpha]